MIRYSLICSAGHGFDSWLANADAFTTLKAAKQLVCPVCGSQEVEKALMAPAIQRSSIEKEEAAAPQLRGEESEIERALAAMRREIEENSEYVGMNFVSEARKMHLGEAEERSIYGEARLDEARQLLEEGIPVAPLPFMPSRKAN